MSSTGTKPDPLSQSELKRLLLEAIANMSDIDNPESYHALFEHLERGLQTDDVIYGIRTDWKRFKVLPFNEYFWQWKYKIYTENVDEKELTIVVAVDTANRLFEVITRWKEDEDDCV